MKDTRKDRSHVQKNTFLFFILFALWVMSSTTAIGQSEETSRNDPMSLDSSIRHGQLPNGFSYFIKSVPGPQAKLYFRLYNKVGSNQEDSDQLNFAHAIEHLAFFETKNFPLGIRNSEAINELGMDLYDYIAFNGRTHTQYTFDAPADQPEAIDVGLKWFKDIAVGLRLTEKDINQVRGELRQELLMGAGSKIEKYLAENELYHSLFPCVKSESQFFEHHKNFDSNSLRRFYKDWYRPEFLAISVVGDIDNPDELEKQIIKTFGNIESGESDRQLRNCNDQFYNLPPQFVLVEEQQNSKSKLLDSTSSLHFFFRDPVTSENIASEVGLERLMKFQLLQGILRERLEAKTGEYMSFQVGVGDLYKYRGLPPTMEVELILEDNYGKAAVEKTIEIVHQLEKDGVTKSEYDEQLRKVLRSLESLDENEVQYWISEIEKYYNLGEALPAAKVDLLKNRLAALSITEFNSYVKKFLDGGPDDIGIITTAANKALRNSEKEVRSWIEATYENPVRPYETPFVPEALMSIKEIAGLQEEDFVDQGIAPSGAREIILDNGVKVIFKPYKPSVWKNNIKIHGFSLKGANSLHEKLQLSAINAPTIVMHSGVNGLNKFELQSFFAEKGILPGAIFPYIDYNETGIHAQAELEDLEILLQLIYLSFTDPNKDSLAFQDWKLEERKAYYNPTFGLLGADFDKTIDQFTGEISIGNVIGKRSLQGTKRYKSVQETNLDSAFNSYLSLFGTASDFIFLITGDFQVEKIMPLVQRYLGNLPNSINSVGETSMRHVDSSMPLGPVIKEFEPPGNDEMKNIFHSMRCIRKSENPYDWQEHLQVEALGGIIQQKLWGLRFKKGYALYNVKGGGHFNKNMNRHEIDSFLDVEPKEFANIQEEVRQIFSDIKSGVISQNEFEEGLFRVYNRYDISKANIPRVMNERLYSHYRFDLPWIHPEKLEQYVRSLKIEDIVKVAQKICSEKNLYEFVMRDQNLN